MLNLRRPFADPFDFTTPGSTGGPTGNKYPFEVTSLVAPPCLGQFTLAHVGMGVVVNVDVAYPWIIDTDDNGEPIELRNEGVYRPDMLLPAGQSRVFSLIHRDADEKHPNLAGLDYQVVAELKYVRRHPDVDALGEEIASRIYADFAAKNVDFFEIDPANYTPILTP